MSIRNFILLVLIGYVITNVACISICSLHGRNQCPCTNAILKTNQPLIEIGNHCARCGGYQPSMVYYKPGNDLYTCSTIVKPAFVPETCPCYCHVTPVQDKDSEERYDRPKIIDRTPVDSVSLTLAQSLREQSKYHIPEAKFWFGPAKMPRIDLPKIIRKNVPEERLIAIERDIIELKPRKSKSGWDDSHQSDDSSSDSSSSDSSSSSESNENSKEIKRRTAVTYKEIGYDRINVNDGNSNTKIIRLLPPTSMDIRPVEETSDSEYQSCPFVPGQVILRKRKINPFGGCFNQRDSYEDMADRLESFVEKSRSKFYENIMNRGEHGWNFMTNYN